MLSRPQSSFDRPSGHLAIVMRAFEGGGSQRDMVLLCNALAAKGVNPTILVLRDGGPLRGLLDPTIPVVVVPGRRMRYALPGLRRTIRALAPDIVVSSETGLNLCTLVAVRAMPRRARPRLIWREVCSPSMARRRDPDRLNRIAYGLFRWLYRYADRIVTLTEGGRRDLVENFAVPADLISVMRTNAVIPPAVVERLANWDGEAGRERDLVVCVGSLSPEKDQRTLLQAMTLLPKNRAWRLALVGDGPERAALEAFVAAHGLADRVSFTGFVVDPFAWMMRARVAVCASIYEGLGNAIIEALACGTPVVSTDCPYGPRETLQNGRYGALVPVGDAEAMAAAIEAALERTPDRLPLMRRGLDYTAARAAERFLEIVADVAVTATGAGAALDVARAS
jgi:glycosyltransferase involved in cell wall biosynthesis